MPSDRVACPLCSKMVSRINLGAHFLSKAHSHDFSDDKDVKKTLTAFYNSKVVRKEDFEALPTFYIKNEGFNLCLGCKRCYTTDSIRKEKRNHFENHPECLEPFKTALTTLCGPKDVVMTDPDALQKENDALKKEIERLKKQQVIPTPAPVVMTSDAELQEKYDTLLSEKEELEEDSDKMRARMSKWRGLWKEFLGDAFPEKTDFDMELEIVKEFVAKSKKQPSERKEEAPASAPAPKVNQSKVDAYMAAHVAQDLEAQGRIGTSLTNAEFTEVTRRIADLAPKNTIVQATNPLGNQFYHHSAPLAQSDVPGPLGTAKLLQSTKPKMMAKQVMPR